MLVSLEGSAMGALVLWRAMQLRRTGVAPFKTPYVVFVLAYVVMFAIAFTVIGNFGILVRQRTMLLPLVFMLLAADNSKQIDAPATGDSCE
jgi:ABC-type spermidine/putrescine transport system permease subunit II